MKSFFVVLGVMGMLALAVLISREIEREANPMAVCCQECLAAWSQSPAAISREGALCVNFMTAKPVSGTCEAFFVERQMTVAACSKV